MDERTLNDLLECSVCLERLDTSSKVLPCQHTFCKKCLEEIVATKQELRCPECRVLVTTTIDELPPNVLLMRILGGMMRTGNPQLKKRAPLPIQKLLPSTAALPITPILTADAQISRPYAPPKQPALGSPIARALYDYQSVEPGDLVFRKGDIITLRNKVDVYWCQGECSGRAGVFPLSYVQVITPLPPQVATARALYDFKMNNDEEEGCLSFRKDEVLAVLRRVDENWVEGRLGGRVGIFPLAFVELNPVARALMKLSANEQPGPSRVAPPTPTFDESTPLISTESHISPCTGSTTAAENNQHNSGLNGPASSVAIGCDPRIPVSNAVSDSSSSTSTTTPNSSSNSSSSSSTAPSSPASPPPPTTQQPPPLQSPPPPQLNPFLRPQTILLPTSHITTQARDKRHSFSAMTPSQPAPPTNRHSAEILSGGEPTILESSPNVKSPAEVTAQPTQPPRDSNGSQLVRNGSQRHRRSGSDFTVIQMPAPYVALYPYKPQKADELELKKGGVYVVTERCQDGWFKGISNRTQKCGVFPGNYVTLAKPLQNSQSRVVSSSPRDSSSSPSSALKSRTSSGSPGLRSIVTCGLAPPELPPRAASPAARVQRPPWGSSAVHQSDEGSAGSEMMSNAAPQVLSKNELTPRHVSNAVSPPPNVSVSLSPAPSKSAEKAKEKKEKTGLMKRLAAMKRSKSPSAPTYSMDNPVFDDSPVSTGLTSPHPVHARSGSCPSQLIELHQQRVMSASLSARVRHKERPSVAAAHFSHPSSRMTDNGGTTNHGAGATHRKSSSLDGSDPRNPKQLVPPVRERYRCIVPYPPNSEYELELRVGDIIYVHRKREDGWYKGTQQRTGRTGLFPASFVECY